MSFKKIILICLVGLLSTGFALAQSGNYLKVKLLDSLSMEPVSFATVYVSKDGTTENAYYSLTDVDGQAVIDKIKKGDYIFKAELMGYEMRTLKVKIDKLETDLGTIKMKLDVTTLSQATVTAVGNPIVVKKDTIEYTASSFKTTDNDMLEELLKKLPGVEVSSDGTVTANGETINKITIDGRTFFLDDPQLATKNIPAKIVEKVKVVQKKSEQAEFTGIDDGEEETIIDLSIMPGMMSGWFGNIAAGGGYDMKDAENDTRYQASGMVGRFTDKTQISIIGNGNNTNNRGFQDMTSDMMNSMRSSTGQGGGMMRGGGGGGMFGGRGGITTSWMGGVNANGYLLKDDAMEIGGNYLYSGSDRVLSEKSNKTTMINDTESLITENIGLNVNRTQGHRAGAEIDYKINDKTSILFRPQFNIGYGDFVDSTKFASDNTKSGKVNDGYSLSTGKNNSFRTNGRLLFRQKIGNTPGRTLSFNVNYSISQNDMDGINESVTNQYKNNELEDAKIIDQQYRQNQDSYSLRGRLTYTEPLGKNFFVEAAYQYGFNQNNSEKLTYNKDLQGKYKELDTLYSSSFRNTFINQDAQLNLVKQEEKYNLQVGFSVQPSSTKSIEKNLTGGKDDILAYNVLNFSPSARFDYRFSDYKFVRVNYRGSTNQPSITQLQPVPDNSNPLNISLGNPSLQPEFSHRVWTDFRYTDMKSYASFNANLGASYVKDDIITASWYNKAGVQYSAPINSKEGTYSANAMVMFNTPIAKSNFSIMSFTNFRLSKGLSYTGTGEATTLDEIYNDLISGRTISMNVGENLSIVYRNDYLETRLGGRASYSNAWYSIQEQKKPDTWTNSINAEVNGTLPWGMEIKTDARYNFYIGYDEGYGDPELIWNAEISQLLFNKSATLRFKMYDILNQAKSVYRSTQDNYIQDVVNNTLGRYFMVSLTFRFGNFGNMQNGMRGGPGHGPGRGPGFGGPGRR